MRKKMYLYIIVFIIILYPRESVKFRTIINAQAYGVEFENLTEIPWRFQEIDGYVIAINGNILTLNTADFHNYDTISIVIPEDALSFEPFVSQRITAVISATLRGTSPPLFHALEVHPVAGTRGTR